MENDHPRARSYDHLTVERKWQAYWAKNGTFGARIDRSKPKYYILDMFPYPSGAGLHVGHVTGYTATDILARYKRQKGFNVLHPMGWDSFGLQAEQYAVRTGAKPADTTAENIATYRRQLRRLGFSYDWDREFATSDPSYYKWTQWIFTKLYEKGLAYEAEVLVNYCPDLGTVLANEEVENGRSREGGYPVKRHPHRQWILRITEYAERLLQDLDDVDWPEHIKRMQRNWIGKSVGVRLFFLCEGTEEEISVFTTRVDTLFGVTFLALAPEHPLTNVVTTGEKKEEVARYVACATSKSDLERTDLNRDKTGVATGACVINPVNGRRVPVWVADYVLADYGYGAVMGVPGADERDFAFAEKYDLPVIAVYDPESDDPEVRRTVIEGKRCWTGEGKATHGKSECLDINGLSMEEAKERVTKWLVKNGRGKKETGYKLRDWLFSRQRYWGEPIPILRFQDGSIRTVDQDELPLTLPELDDYKPRGKGKTPLDNVSDWIEVTDPKTGKRAMRETNTMPQWAGSCWYYLRFCDPLNDAYAWGEEAEAYWMPVDMYVGGAEHAVLHLLYARFWHKVLFDLGLTSTKEPFQALRNQGLVTAHAFKREGGGYVAREDVVMEGDKAFERRSHEPLSVLLEKMSKSKLNGVTPDEIVERLGADSLRLYEMFMGPFDKEKFWNSNAIAGCRRFLDRFYALVVSRKRSDATCEEGMRLAHILVKGVADDIESMFFNTAIAKLMEFVNAFSKLESYPTRGLVMATQALNPFAPHLAEECFEILRGKGGSLAYEPYPEYDPSYLQTDSVTFVFQVNGRVRGKKELPKGTTKEELTALLQADEHCAKYLRGKIVKVIFVPDTLINVVVAS